VRCQHASRELTNLAYVTLGSGVAVRYSFAQDEAEGKRIALVDTGFLRIEDIQRLAHMLRTADAIEVHILVAMPRILSHCTFDAKELLHNYKTILNIVELLDGSQLEVDSIYFLSLEGFYTVRAHATPDLALCYDCFRA